MNIYFATNRNIVKETAKSVTFGPRFHADGPQFFRVGVAAVEQVKGEPTDDAAWQVEAACLYSEKGKKKQAVRGSQELFDDLRRKLKDENQDVLVLLHGYASDFEDSVARAAALQHLYSHGASPEAPDPLVFVFSWPSNGKVFPAVSYFSDRDDAEASGLAMARALVALIDFMTGLAVQDQPTLRAARLAGQVPPPEELARCGQQLHLLAHSMGNWALRHAVLSLARLLGRRPLPRLFKNAFLMAADEDADCLASEAKLGLLPQLAQAVHVYHSAEDKALQISDTTKFNPDRLGADGPADFDQLPARVFTVDCSKVDRTRPEHGSHQYYRIRREVIDDVKEIIAGTPLDRLPGREIVRPGRSWRLEPRPEG